MKFPLDPSLVLIDLKGGNFVLVQGFLSGNFSDVCHSPAAVSPVKGEVC